MVVCCVTYDPNLTGESFLAIDLTETLDESMMASAKRREKVTVVNRPQLEPGNCAWKKNKSRLMFAAVREMPAVD